MLCCAPLCYHSKETGPRNALRLCGDKFMKLLLIEDDKESAKYLMKGLREQGWVVDHVVSGKDGLFMAASEKYDALIVDRMVPEVDGVTIVQTLRASGNETPAIMLTALDQVED